MTDANLVRQGNFYKLNGLDKSVYIFLVDESNVAHGVIAGYEKIHKFTLDGRFIGTDNRVAASTSILSLQMSKEQFQGHIYG